jgi:hypothetical protein
MVNEPKCQLCSSDLVKESNVSILNQAGLVVDYFLAWVCKNCGSVWPIAAQSHGIIKQWNPLWQNGERAE